MKALRFIKTERGCFECVSHKSSTKSYSVLRINGKAFRLHRVIYELHNGPLPINHQVHHKCENPRCCAPEHLELLSDEEHILETTHLMQQKTKTKDLLLLDRWLEAGRPTNVRDFATTLGIPKGTAWQQLQRIKELYEYPLRRLRG
jgi:hypothetical protein